MPDEANPLDCQTPSDEHFDPSKSNRLCSIDHPKNLYVSPADFEWLLRYLEEDDDANDSGKCTNLFFYITKTILSKAIIWCKSLH